jgi:transposase
MSDTSATKKATIVALKEQKLSNRAVAAKENVSASTVSRINARYGANHQFEAKSPRPGSEHEAQKAMRMLSSGKARNASDLKQKLFPNIHEDTIRKALKKRGLNAYQRQSKPLLTRGHQRKRIDWAEL